MAMVQTQPTMRHYWRDASDTLGSTRVWFRSSADVFAAASAAAIWRAALAPLSGCVITGTDIVYPAIDTAPIDAPGATGVLFGAVFVFSTGTAGQYGMVWLPSIGPGLAVTSGPTAGLDIDRSLPAVAAFIAAILAGGYCNPAGHVLTVCEAAFYTVRP